jgi:hypothetical protein
MPFTDPESVNRKCSIAKFVDRDGCLRLEKKRFLFAQSLELTRIAVVEVIEWKVPVSRYVSLCTWEAASTYALSNPIP